jgi:hypothetical protein
MTTLIQILADADMENRAELHALQAWDRVKSEVDTQIVPSDTKRGGDVYVAIEELFREEIARTFKVAFAAGADESNRLAEKLRRQRGGR